MKKTLRELFLNPPIQVNPALSEKSKKVILPEKLAGVNKMLRQVKLPDFVIGKTSK